MNNSNSYNFNWNISKSLDSILLDFQNSKEKLNNY